MKVVFKFIIAIILIEVGFFLLLGDRIVVKENSNDLINYTSENIPSFGKDVDISISDVGEMFLEADDIMGIKTDFDCYYIVQMIDGRFIVIKTLENSEIDNKINEYAENCNEFYRNNIGKRPKTLYLQGSISFEPELENDYNEYLQKGIKNMMASRGYFRMDVEPIIVELYENAARQSMIRVLKSSLNFLLEMNKVLKTILGGIATLLGIFMIITTIKSFLHGDIFGSDISDNEILIDNDVFKNIQGRENSNNASPSWNDELDALDLAHERKEAKHKEREARSIGSSGGLRLKEH